MQDSKTGTDCPEWLYLLWHTQQDRTLNSLTKCQSWPSPKWGWSRSGALQRLFPYCIIQLICDSTGRAGSYGWWQSGISLPSIQMLNKKEKCTESEKMGCCERQKNVWKRKEKERTKTKWGKKKSAWRHTEINKINRSRFSFLPEYIESTGHAKERQIDTPTSKHITSY